MAKKIASLYAEIGADTTKLKRGLNESKGLLTETKDKFDSLKKSILPATAIVGGFGVALGQVWDMAKEGAAMEYSIQKFDRLSASIGTTADLLLNDLKKATKGTRTDMQLTSTAADLMGLGLVKTHDQVVRLTKVVGGLNMDTNQLVLTLANQTTMRFDQLGVSVDGFDVKVKNLEKTGLNASDAFTEAFLQQAEKQLTLVGDAADTTAGRMAALEVKAKNLGDTIKMKLVPAAEGFITSVDIIVSGRDKIQAALSEHEEQVRGTAGSYDDYVSEMQRAAQAAGYHYDALGLLRDGLNRVQEGHYLYSEAVWDNGEAVDFVGRMAKKATGNVKDLGDDASDASEKMDDLSGAADGAKNAILGLNDIDLNLASTIERELDKIEFMLAGGLDLQAVTDEISAALGSGKITPEQAREMFNDAYVAAQALQVDMDNITADDAAKNVSDTLGLSLIDAKSKVLEVQGELDNITKDLYIRVHVEMDGNIPGGENIGALERRMNEDLNGNGIIGRASGGPVSGSSPYIVGEVGPEIFVPKQSGSVISNDELQRLFGQAGKGVTVIVNADIANQVDVEDMAYRVADVIQKRR